MLLLLLLLLLTSDMFDIFRPCFQNFACLYLQIGYLITDNVLVQYLLVIASHLRCYNTVELYN